MGHADWPEVDFLLAASMPGPDAERHRRCSDLIAATPAMDWAYVIEQASRHRVLAMMGHHLDEVGLFDVAGGVWVPERDLYRGHVLYHRERNRRLLAETHRVLDALETVGVHPVLRKGAYLANLVYDDPGMRPMSDIDAMIPRASAEAAMEGLASIGYVPGRLSPDGRTVEENSRREQMYWRLHTNSLPTVWRPVDDPYVPAFGVDLCVDLALPATGLTLDPAALLNRAVVVDLAGRPARVPAPEDMVVDIATHLHKESTTLRYIRMHKHQRLVQYWDVAAFVGAVGERFDWPLLTSRARDGAAAGPVYFALAHLDELAPGIVPASALDALRACGPDVHAGLDRFGAVDRTEPLVWDVDFRSRTFAASRVADVPVSGSLI